MDEPASFETRAVLAPRRARRARLALLLPVVALAATAWAGLSGARPDAGTADIPEATVVVAPTRKPEPPAHVFGLDVHRLDDVRPLAVDRDEEIAVAGWYVPTAIRDCPPLAAIYREASLPEVRGDADPWAFCVRSGLLYATRPDPDNDRSLNAGLPAIAVTIVIGVVAPRELEEIGTNGTEVVVVGRLVASGEGCSVATACRHELEVDHVAWTPAA